MESDMRFQIKRLNHEGLADFRSLVNLFNMVFEEEPRIGSDNHLRRLLSRAEFIVLVALTEDEVAGGLTAYELSTYYSDSSFGTNH